MKKILYALCLSSCALLYPFDHLTSVPITSAETYNERNVEFQLTNTGSSSSDLTNVVTSINSLSDSQQRNALNKLSGEQFANIIQINQVASQQFMRRMYDTVRFDSLGLQCGQNCDQFRIWSAIGGGQATLRKSHHSKGFKLDNANFAVGVLKPLNFCFLKSWLTVGAAVSYERDNIRFDQGGKDNLGENWQGALYYMWNNCHFYSFSATILGNDFIRIKRPINFGTTPVTTIHRRARSRARITQWTSYSEIGMNLNYNCLYFQPFLGIEYASYRRHALSEHHAHSVSLHIRGKSVCATIGRAGVHLTMNLPCWNLLLSGDLAYRYRFNLHRETIRANFKECGSEYRVRGVRLTRNGVEGALNLSKCFCDCWQAYLEVAGEKWSRYSAWNVSGGLNFTW